jgi:hypothetical protein
MKLIFEHRITPEDVRSLTNGQYSDFEIYVQDTLMDFYDREIPEDFHLCSYNEYKKVRDKLENFLRSKKIDLSFDSMKLPAFGIKIGGNYSGIAHDFLRGVIELYWEQISPNELKNIQINNVYKKDQYGFCVPASPREIRIVNSWQDIGIGSQSSVIETKTELYVDDDNNILVSTYSLTWD